jgi:hypothetical protein
MALAPEQQILGSTPELQDVGRQRKLAELLMSQGTQQPQGQMISGYYVAPSLAQQLNPLANILAGQAVGEKADTKQTQIAAALRVQGDKAAEDVMQTYKKDPQLALQKASQYQQYPQVKALLPQLSKVALSEPIKPTTDMQNYQFAVSQGYKGSLNDFRNQLTPYQTKSLAIQAGNQAQSRVPMGYRMTNDGGLEPIPGGPADQKAQTVNAGRETVDTLIAGLKDQYGILKEGGGITTQDKSLMNVPAYLSSTAAGQATGKMFGTQNQSARNTIVQSRPLLLAAIKNATGMSAKQMDSNVELKMYLAAATDPTLDYEANMAALNQLETLYGLSGTAKAASSGGASSGSNFPSASDIAAEKARRQGNKK